MSRRSRIDALDRLAHGVPPPALVQRAQRAHRHDDGMGRRQLRRDVGAVVPPAARGAELGQLVVAARERRRAQGGDDRDLVGGVVDRGEHREQLLHLGGGVHERLALDPGRDPGVVEGLLEVGERGARREQHRDVGVARGLGVLAAVGVAPRDRPALGAHAVDQRGELLGLQAAQRREVGLLGVLAADDGDRTRRRAITTDHQPGRRRGSAPTRRTRPARRAGRRCRGARRTPSSRTRSRRAGTGSWCST